MIRRVVIMDNKVDLTDASLINSPVIVDNHGSIYVNYSDIRINKMKNLTKNPPKSNCFIERDVEIENLKDILEGNNVAVIINGMGGIGKTEIAKSFYWKENDSQNYKYFGWIDYRDNLKKSFLNSFNFNISFNDNDSMDAKFNTLLNELYDINDKVLLFIDNFATNRNSDILNEECEILNSLNNNFKIVITSREVISSFKEFKLCFLSEEKCRELFYAYYNVDKDDEKLNIILKLLGYHTLTIELLAKTANECEYTIEKLLTIVKEIGFSLNEVLNEEVEYKRYSDLLFNHLMNLFSLVDLNDIEKYIMTNISILPSKSVKKEDFRNWIGLDNNKFLNKLIKKGWINEEQLEGSHYIICHQLIQEVARKKLQPTLDTCVNMINSISDTLINKPGENRLHKVFYLDIGISISNNIKSRISPLNVMLNNLALLFSAIGDFESALSYQLEACEINVRENSYDASLGIAYCNLANIYNDNSDFQNALKYGLLSKKILETYEDKSNTSSVYQILSVCYNNNGDINKAIEYGEKAKAFAQDLGNNLILATSYNNLSLFYSEKGDYSSSLKYALNSKDIREKILDKDHPSLANVYNNLFLLYRTIKKFDLALEYILKANIIIEKNYSNNHPRLCGHYSNMAMIYHELGDNDNALTYGRKAEKIGEQIFHGVHEIMSIVYTSLTTIYQAIGNHDKALYYSKKDMDICKEIYHDKHPLLSVAYNNLAMIYYGLKNYQEALKYALLAKEIREENYKGVHEKLATSYNNLMLIYFALENNSDALLYGLKSEVMFREIFGENNLSVTTVHMNLASLYLQEGLYDDAEQYYLKAERSIKLININTKFYLYQVYFGLYTIYMIKDDNNKRKKYSELVFRYKP